MLKLMTTGSELSRPADVTACLAAVPFLELSDWLAKAIQTLRELAPGARELTVYERLYARLHDAIESAQRSELWVGTREAAERLGCSVSTVQHQCSLDEDERPFIARKIGGTWRIDASSLPPTGTAS